MDYVGHREACEHQLDSCHKLEESYESVPGKNNYDVINKRYDVIYSQKQFCRQKLNQSKLDSRLLTKSHPAIVNESTISIL